MAYSIETEGDVDATVAGFRVDAGFIGLQVRGKNRSEKIDGALRWYRVLEPLLRGRMHNHELKSTRIGPVHNEKL